MNKEWVPEETIGFLVNRLSFILRQNIAALFKENNIDLTPEECVVLTKLWQKDRQVQSDLAESTIKNQTTITRIIEKLEKKQLVNRVHSEKDRRQVIACLTQKGKDTRGVVIPLIKKLMEQAAMPISKKELASTKKNLQKIIDGLMENTF